MTIFVLFVSAGVFFDGAFSLRVSLTNEIFLYRLHFLTQTSLETCLYYILTDPLNKVRTKLGKQ